MSKPMLSPKVILSLVLLVLGLLVTSGCQKQGSETVETAVVGEAGADSVTIYRDAFGTPQVFADSNYGVYFGYGYAVGQDRLFQMEMLKRTAQGRVAEVLGADFLSLDQKLRTEYNHPIVRVQVDQLTPRDLDILQGYADGMNAWIEEATGAQADLLPKPFEHYGFLPSRWNAYDVATIFVGSIAHRYADFNSERDNLEFLRAMEARHGKEDAWKLFNAVKWLTDDTSPTTVPREGPLEHQALVRPSYLDEGAKLPSLARAVTDVDGRYAGLSIESSFNEVLKNQIASNGYLAHPDFSPASNYWAISEVNDAAGVLLNGPQFGFAVPSYVYGIGLHGGDFDIVGNTLLALPAFLFAHNNHLAWGSTAGISDQTDEFWLTLNPENPEQYWHNGKWVNFNSWEERIVVKDGALVSVTARRSVHGMVLAHDPDAGVAVARARAWEGQSVQDLMTWVWLATDHSLEQAEQRLAGKTTNINMYTMDRAGQLGYVHSGRYPQRAAGHDPRLPAIGDGSMDWQGMRPYDDNPKVRQPDSGFIVNWNNRPSADWISSDLWSYTWSPADRVHILIDELNGVLGSTVADVVDINTRSSFEDVNHRYLMPLLEDARIDLLKGNADDARVLRVADAIDLLVAWDKSWRVDQDGFYGPAPTLMEAFVEELQRQVFLDDVGEEEYYRFAATNYPSKPLGASWGTSVAMRALIKWLEDVRGGETPQFDLLNGESITSVVSKSLSLALVKLDREQGADMTGWRRAAAPMEWTPFNFRGVPQADSDSVLSLPGYQNRGSENNVFVATGEGIEARDVIPGGQGGHRLSSGVLGAHFDDQFDLYQQFKYKPVPFEREDIETLAVSQTVIPLE